MDKLLSMKQKNAIDKLTKQASFEEGIKELIFFRDDLLNRWIKDITTCQKESLYKMPFINHTGFENKTLIYSLYHVIRIEDIVCNDLMDKKEEVFFEKDYKTQMNSPLITTGNELIKKEIEEFSRHIHLEGLVSYAKEVETRTNSFLRRMNFEDLKKKVTEENIMTIQGLGVVSLKEESCWLIDYWKSKNYMGLIKMPLSRHWIMHYEASKRILAKIEK